nr:MAG TPA: hypothetical protein [Caudoviricetes sp.]
MRMINKANLDNLIAMCDAVKTTNDYPLILLISQSTYERHKDWFDGLDVDKYIIKPIAELKQDGNIYVVPYDRMERYYYE